jgi:hypothetical protein
LETQAGLNSDHKLKPKRKRIFAHDTNLRCKLTSIGTAFALKTRHEFRFWDKADKIRTMGLSKCKVDYCYTKLENKKNKHSSFANNLFKSLKIAQANAQM